MSNFSTRRGFLLGAAALPLAAAINLPAWGATRPATPHDRLALLESTMHHGRLGIFALNTGDGTQLSYNADQRFPMCSTFKAILTAAILDESTRNKTLMAENISYLTRDIVSNSPVTGKEKHLYDGMTVEELCLATMQYSDNTAANLLMGWVGGPKGVTAYARSIGDTEFQLDSMEPHLSPKMPNDPRNTTTPRAMGLTLQRLALGTALRKPQQAQLQNWLRSSRVSANLIRAGVPSDWTVGDKSGAGDFGSRGDIAVLWPPGRSPVILTVYTTHRDKKAKWRDDIIAAASRIVVDWLSVANRSAPTMTSTS